MRFLVFIEKDFPGLLNVLNNNFPAAHIQLTYDRKNLLKNVGDFSPDVVIAQLYKHSDIELVEHIVSAYPLIIVSDSIEPDLALKFLKSGVNDWILFKNIDRLSVSIKFILEKPVVNYIKKQSANVFLNIIQNLKEFAIMTDSEGNILICNESFKKNFSTPEGYRGKNILTYVASEDRLKFKDAFESSVLTNFLEVPELRLEIDGKIIYTHLIGHSVHNQSGKVENIVLLFYNITEKKLYEQQLKESERLFRTVADTAVFAIFIYQENKFLYVNSSALQMSGYSYEELMSMNFWDVVHPDYKDMVRERGQKRLVGENVPSRYEFKIMRKDKTERWIDFSGSFLEYGGKPAALGIAIDITERKIAEESLKNSHNFYLKLFNEFPALLWRTNVDGKLIFFNKTWLNFRGKTIEQEINGEWINEIHPEDIDMVINSFNKFFKAKEEFEMEYRIKNYQSVYRWIFIKGYPLYDTDNKFAGFIGSGYDITEKKEYEEKIKNLNEELKQKIKYLEDFKSIAIERELKMIELKEMIKKLTGGQQ